MKRLIATIVIAATIALAGCKMGSQIYEGADVSKSEVIILNKKPHQGAIHSFNISGCGNIDGHAEIFLFSNGDIYKSEELKGKIKFKWGGDYYNDKVEIHYLPNSVTNGCLRLKYKFNDL